MRFEFSDAAIAALRKSISLKFGIADPRLPLQVLALPTTLQASLIDFK